jgi:DNA-binding MarR family transcriptional regulator
MRILWQEARDRIDTALHDAGYDDIRAEHFAVLQYPGPDGARPSTLAVRARMSKQAINHLLTSLERGGYLRREPDPDERNARVVRLTRRGHQLIDRIRAAVLELEREWEADVGKRRLADLRVTLAALREARQRSRERSQREL